MEKDMNKGGRGKMIKTVEKLKRDKGDILTNIQGKSKNERHTNGAECKLTIW